MNRSYSTFLGFEVPYFFFAVKSEEVKNRGNGGKVESSERLNPTAKRVPLSQSDTFME